MYDDGERWYKGMNGLCAVAHLTSTVLVGSLGGTELVTSSASLVHVTQTRDELVVTPLDMVVSYFAIIMFVGMWSGGCHAYLAFRYDGVDDILSTGRNPVRWVDYGPTSAAMVVAVGAQSGVTEVWSLVGMALIQGLLMLFCDVAEAEMDRGRRFVGLSGLLAVFHLVGVWGPVFNALAAASVPAVVYVIVTVLLVLFLSFGVVYAFVAANPDVNPYHTEILYMTLGVVSKLELQWLFYGGVIRRGDAALAGITVGVLLFGVVFYWFARHSCPPGAL
jgi:hypothetical protein